MHVSGLSGALDALQRSAESVNRAAERIARAGLDTPAETAPNPDAVDSGDELVTGAVDSLVARTLFAAAIRLAQSANENIAATLRLNYLRNDS